MTAQTEDQWEDWMWVCPKCGNHGIGTGEKDAAERCERHVRMVHGK